MKYIRGLLLKTKGLYSKISAGEANNMSDDIRQISIASSVYKGQIGMDENSLINDIFEQNYSWLFNYCLANLEGDEQAAMDAVDTVFIIVNSKSDILESVKDIRSWLFTIAKNTVRNTQRKRKRYEHRNLLFDPWSIDPNSYTSGTPASWWERKAVAALAKEDEIDDIDFSDDEIDYLKDQFLYTLSAKERELFCSHYDDGITLSELSESYGISKDAIRMRLSRISMKLTERIKIYFENQRSN